MVYIKQFSQTHSHSVYTFGEINLAYCVCIFNWDGSKITHFIPDRCTYYNYPFQMNPAECCWHCRCSFVENQYRFVFFYAIAEASKCRMSRWVDCPSKFCEKNRFLMLTSCFQQNNTYIGPQIYHFSFSDWGKLFKLFSLKSPAE